MFGPGSFKSKEKKGRRTSEGMPEGEGEETRNGNISASKYFARLPFSEDMETSSDLPLGVLGQQHLDAPFRYPVSPESYLQLAVAPRFFPIRRIGRLDMFAAGHRHAVVLGHNRRVDPFRCVELRIFQSSPVIVACRGGVCRDASNAAAYD